MSSVGTPLDHPRSMLLFLKINSSTKLLHLHTLTHLNFPREHLRDGDAVSRQLNFQSFPAGEEPDLKFGWPILEGLTPSSFSPHCPAPPVQNPGHTSYTPSLGEVSLNLVHLLAKIFFLTSGNNTFFPVLKYSEAEALQRLDKAKQKCLLLSLAELWGRRGSVHKSFAIFSRDLTLRLGGQIEGMKTNRGKSSLY